MAKDKPLIFVKPKTPETMVPIPGGGGLVPASGRLMYPSVYVNRRLRDGSLVLADPPKS